MTSILVLGGSGFVGRSLCRHLASLGGTHRITVPTRRRAGAKALTVLPNVQLVTADVHDAGQLARLIGAHDAVVNLIAILHGTEAQFEHVHVGLPRQLAAACAATGTRRVVHVSALGVDATQPSLYLASKAAGEAVLRAAPIDLTVLRPSVIFGAEDRFMNTFAGLQRLAPLVPLASTDARFQPVWVDDVARAIGTCLSRPATAGQVYECAGPVVYTLRELVESAGRWSGHARRVMPLPAALGRLQARMMELLPGEPLISRDNLDSMRTPNVASGRLPSLRDLGIEPAALADIGPRLYG